MDGTISYTRTSQITNKSKRDLVLHSSMHARGGTTALPHSIIFN